MVQKLVHPLLVVRQFGKLRESFGLRLMHVKQVLKWELVILGVTELTNFHHLNCTFFMYDRVWVRDMTDPFGLIDYFASLNTIVQF